MDVTLGHLGHLPVARVVEGQVGLGFDLGEEKQSYVLRKNLISNLIKLSFKWLASLVKFDFCHHRWSLLKCVCFTPDLVFVVQ